MTHERPELAARPRERTGSLYARRLRRDGQLPAVIYGHQRPSIPISIDEKEILTHIRHGHHVMTLQVEGAEPETCLVKELQYGYLGDNVIHVDFTRVDLEEEVEVQVQLAFTGEPAAAQQPGAVLSTDMTSLPVVCRVDAIPDEIRVDLTSMGDGTLLTAGDIELPPGVRAAVEPDTPVSHITFVEQEAEVTAAEEVEIEAGPAEPEVITEAREEEEQGEKKESESS